MLWNGVKMPIKTVPNWGDFTPVNDEIKYRLIWRSFGAEKTGKDHFGLTAPGPIAIQSFDIGLEGVVEKFAKGIGVPKRDIFTCEYEYEKSFDKAAAQALMDKFDEDFEVALKLARTIIWDTETELWEVARHAEHGINRQGVATDAPKDYVKLNGQYRDRIQRAYDCGVNLQLIQKVKEKWGTYEVVDRDTGRKTTKPYATGIMEPTGFKEAGYIVQANLEHYWEKERGFVVRVLNCRQNMAVAGEEFVNTSFPELATLIFGEESEEAWV